MMTLSPFLRSIEIILKHAKSVKTCNCFCNALILSSHSEKRKFEIIGHLQQMGFTVKSLTKYDT